MVDRKALNDLANVTTTAARFKALVMVVDRNRQNLFGPFLTDNILVENVLDLMRLGKLVPSLFRMLLEFLADYVVAELDTLVADENRGARNQLAYFVLALAAKRTIEEFSVFALTAVLVAHAGSTSVT